MTDKQSQQPPLHVIELQLSNVKRIKAARIRPNGSLVQITGRNGQGKTSVLDSLRWLFEGARAIDAVPVRRGEERAIIKADLGELIVTRTISAAGTTALTVTSAEGAQYKSPQAILNALVGDTVDPVAFKSMDGKEQFDVLRKLVPLDVDPEHLAGLNRADYAKRTEKNAEAKRLRAQADGVVVLPDLPAERLDEAALLDELTGVSEWNAAIQHELECRNEELRRGNALADSAKEKLERVAALRREADEVERYARDDADEARSVLEKINALPALDEPKDAVALRTKLDEARGINAAIADRVKRDGLVASAQMAEYDANTLTARMDERVRVIAEAIAKAPMPVPGLGFDIAGEYVTFNGVPFEQASDAEQLRVSLGIALAGNPRLRVVRIRDGSLLDEENLALVAQMAADAQCQVWVERVDSSGKVGIVIEDGEVAAVNEPEPGETDPLFERGETE